MKRFALNNFKSLTDDTLITATTTILTTMPLSGKFTMPEPPLTDIETSRDTFVEKLSLTRRKGSPLDTAVKNAARTELEDLLRRLSQYVNNVANGDLISLLSSGFQLNKISSHNGMPPATPAGLRMRDGRQVKQIVLEFSPVDNILSYEYRYTSEKAADGELVWGEEITRTTRSTENVLAPVTPGVVYYAQVRAFNRYGTSEWSYVLSYMAR